LNIWQIPTFSQFIEKKSKLTITVAQFISNIFVAAFSTMGHKKQSSVHEIIVHV
jgi:hypothetical protein